MTDFCIIESPLEQKFGEGAVEVILVLERLGELQKVQQKVFITAKKKRIFCLKTSLNYNIYNENCIGKRKKLEIYILIIAVMFISIFIGCPLTWDR